MNDRRDRRDPRDRGDEHALRRDQYPEGTGQSRFAQRGFSHEERMHDDDSARRFPGRTGPDPRGSQGEPYGSGGSYGYGGGFEHGGERGYENRGPGGRPGPGNEEFYESTGGFGHDVSGYGRQGLGWPGRNEQRLGTSGAASDRHQPAPRDDSRKGYSQDSGYAQSGGERPESGQGGQGGGGYGRGYGPSSAHSDGRGHEGGGRGTQRFEGRTSGGQPGRGRFYGTMPKGYSRSDERIREDVCDRLSHGHIDPSDVSVTVQEGVVTLEGFVISRSEKFHAEEVADSVLGVKDVENRLRVRRDQPARGEQQTEADTKASTAQSGGATQTLSESETMNEAQSKETARSKSNTNGARS
jgi:osmotically-inducible protein OsmY